MQANRSRDTSPELAVRRLLHRRGLRYRVAARPLPDLRRTADIVFTRQRIAVFIDGCYWHGCPTHYKTPRINAHYWSPKITGNQARDADTDAHLTAAGWKVLRYWEHDDAATVADDVEAHVRGSLSEPAGHFTLDALEAGGEPPAWPALRFGQRWNGWATPVVSREVLASILATVAAHTGEPHRWDGDVAVISGPVDGPGHDPRYEDRLDPGGDGHYDLGPLGWTFVAIEEAAAIQR